MLASSSWNIRLANGLFDLWQNGKNRKKAKDRRRELCEILPGMADRNMIPSFSEILNSMEENGAWR
jgi:hypothetical protein